MKTRKVVSIGVVVGAALLGVVLLSALSVLAATQTDIVGPTGSDQFGQTVTVLANGNLVVVDPGYDEGAITDVGAAYLYNGATGALISKLTGSTASDQIGSHGVITLNSGNYVILSPNWANGLATQAGAATWANGTTGITGTISAANSLVGSATGDYVGISVSALSNNNYVVRSPSWANGTVMNAGAVTWGNGTTGIVGAVSVTNSLVGSTAGDRIGGGVVWILNSGNYVVLSQGWTNGTAIAAGAVTWGDGTTGTSGAVSIANSLVGSTDYDWVGSGGRALSNGNYVVSSNNWHNGTIAYVGAVTWGNGTTGITGTVSSMNSLVGTSALDEVGIGVTELNNGNYVIRSPYWNNDAGAVTWGNGTVGITGTVSSTNSLVGGTANDAGGGLEVFTLSNGNYVVVSPSWDNDLTVDAGAATWGNGTTGITGVVNITNSLIGSTENDGIGGFGVTALSNGNYVVLSPGWDTGTLTNLGAVTWANGMTGITGVVSVTNSLVGSAGSDLVGISATALNNGNYVVGSPNWGNGTAAKAGAATWGNGITGITGTISVTNSLVGSTTDENVGYFVLALSNGNYLLRNPNWDNGTTLNVGAVTWGDGTTGTAGVVSVTNSLVGSTADDSVGSVTVLNNGNYVIDAPYWDNGAASDAGAITWGDGTSGITGVMSVTNSLVGITANDRIGYYGVSPLNNGNYLILSPKWHNGAGIEVGAVTWGNGTMGITGEVSVTNSFAGSTAGDQLGYNVRAFSNGDYVVTSPYYNGPALSSGAVTWGDGITGITGTVTSANSVLGTTAGGGGLMSSAYDDLLDQLIVGRPADNIVTLFRPALTYLLTLNKIGNGSGVVTPTFGLHNYLPGTVITLTATANPGSTFGGWSGAVNGMTNSITLTMDAPKTVAATFTLNTFVITPTAGTNGTLTPGIPQTVNYGASQTFTITANNGYHIADVGVDSISQGALPNYTFDNVIADHIITATFALNPPSGLSAGNDSPTALGQATLFTATTTNSAQVSYAWNFGDGNFGTSATISHTYAAAGAYTAIVTATNSAGLLTTTTTVYVTTNPIAKAGADQIVKVGQAVMLDGGASFDPGNFLPLAYHWQQTGGPTVTLNNAHQVTATFTAPLITQTQTLTFALTVTNTQSIASLPDVIVITVEPYRVALPLVIRQ